MKYGKRGLLNSEQPQPYFNGFNIVSTIRQHINIARAVCSKHNMLVIQSPRFLALPKSIKPICTEIGVPQKQKIKMKAVMLTEYWKVEIYEFYVLKNSKFSLNLCG